MPGASRDQVIHAVVQAVVNSLDPTVRAALRADFDAGEQRVPREHDIVLIRTLGDHVNVVEERDKRDTRQLFRDSV
jgi:hypothetical protein